jgi:two-component system, OmpR family, sensor kinase
MSQTGDRSSNQPDIGRSSGRQPKARSCSLRFAVIAWQSLVLAATLIVFGLVIFNQQRRGAMADVDKKLAERAASLVQSIERPDATGRLRVSETERQRFLQEKDRQFFLLWNAERGVIYASSESFSEVSLREPAQPKPKHGPYTPLPVLRVAPHDDAIRQKVFPGPEDTFILIGRSIENVNAKSAQFGWQLVGAGAFVLLLGIAGSVAISHFALRPIRRMSSAAASISAENLSQRIDETSSPVELRPLAQVLNAAFGRLQAAFARQARFTADAAHELRTPLAVVISQVEVALSKDRTSEEYCQFLDACGRAAKRISAVTEKLLLLARCDSGELALTWQTLDLGALIRQVTDEYEFEAQKRNVSIRLDLVDISCCGDADLLQQAIANLVSNAVRYNTSGGEVRVCLNEDENRHQCMIAVANSGPGIAPEDQSHVFDRFYRADRSRSHQSGGTGLGLAITKEIVEAHGGSISLESDPGKGAIFRVRLPHVDGEHNQ